MVFEASTDLALFEINDPTKKPPTLVSMTQPPFIDERYG